MHIIDAEVASTQIRTTEDDMSLYGRESSGLWKFKQITAWSMQMWRYGPKVLWPLSRQPHVISLTLQHPFSVLGIPYLAITYASSV